jgi:hypothetical protein
MWNRSDTVCETDIIILQVRYDDDRIESVLLNEMFS